MKELFIRNIYAFCDRWCDKCAYTSTCEAYANKGKKDKRELARNDEINRKFWEKVHGFFPEVLISTKTEATQRNIDLYKFEDIPKQVKFDLFQRKAISNDILKAGRMYEDLTDDWIDKQVENGQIVAVESEQGGTYKITKYNNNYDENWLNEMLAIIIRYQLQLYLKLSRVYYSKSKTVENIEENDFIDVVNTTVKMIDRSLVAWHLCNKNIMEQKNDNDIFKIIVLLFRIKNNLLDDFPDAIKTN